MYGSDMVEAMNSVAKLGVELTAEERNLLSVGYKNVLGWKMNLLRNAMRLLTIDDYLLPSSKTGEAAVFYHKMKGDYYRYLAEFKSDAERECWKKLDLGSK
ncbi:14-3-3-like protein GF14 iota [Tanacetum coccineum]